jgi:hypothetical protein
MIAELKDRARVLNGLEEPLKKNLFYNPLHFQLIEKERPPKYYL